MRKINQQEKGLLEEERECNWGEGRRKNKNNKLAREEDTRGGKGSMKWEREGGKVRIINK